MAAKGDNSSLMMDLFKVIQDFPCKYPYRGMVQYICQMSKVTVKEFNNMDVSKHCIFELFGAISQESAVDVRCKMVERIRLDPLYYKRIGHVILGFKNLVLNEWSDVMAKQTTSADKLTIFALSKIYQRHTVIFNASKPWSTLEPDSAMLEEELFENCQIHLAYMGKDQYAMLHRKPFIEQAAPPTLKSMLDPMKIQHTNKQMCQKEPMDLSLQMTRSADVSLDMENSTSNSNNSQKLEEEDEPNRDLLGDNENTITKTEVPVVPQNKTVETPERDKYKKALDALCKTWTEVKLLQMKTSDVKFYLSKYKSSMFSFWRTN